MIRAAGAQRDRTGQSVGDIIHETDLFTTFAHLGGTTANIPTDRTIDGVDQTALFLNGGHSRRDTCSSTPATSSRRP